MSCLELLWPLGEAKRFQIEDRSLNWRLIFKCSNQAIWAIQHKAFEQRKFPCLENTELVSQRISKNTKKISKLIKFQTVRNCGRHLTAHFSLSKIYVTASKKFVPTVLARLWLSRIYGNLMCYIVTWTRSNSVALSKQE